MLQAASQLPRLARRADGLILATYQRARAGSDQMVFAETSRDPYDWSAAAVELGTMANNHDAEPIALPGGSFLVTFTAQSGAAAFNLQARTSVDGARWSRPTRITEDAARHNVQPHPLLTSPGPGGAIPILLFWSHQAGPTPYRDHDIWLLRDLPLPRESIHLPRLGGG